MSFSARASAKFEAGNVSGGGSAFMICDLDGDGLQDVVLIDGVKLTVLYQEPELGFTGDWRQTWQLPDRPCVVWAAKLGNRAESLLVMTSDGLTELCFTNRIGPPSRREIIHQPTILPLAAKGASVMRFALSARTGRGSPLLLVPAPDGLQVWSTQHHAPTGTEHPGEWRRVQTIGHSVDAWLWPHGASPGYTRTFGLDLAVDDVNRDGRDDLMIKRGPVGKTNFYALYLQQTNGLFGLDPAFNYSDRVQLQSWYDWTDLNRDGKIDLIKSVWLNEASFVPGIPSGKVVVAIYFADASGRIPRAPREVFRKNDWLAWLPVVDVDGDGFPDLVLGYSDMDNKESLIKDLTARELDYSLRLYFNRRGKGFPREPDCRRDVVIRLDRADALINWTLPLNFLRRVGLDGDFNGDGKTDLLVQDQKDAAAVYFFASRQKGFSRKPDLRFDCSGPIEGWKAADLNGDGISDLIVKLEENKGFRIFISRK